MTSNHLATLALLHLIQLWTSLAALCSLFAWTLSHYQRAGDEKKTINKTKKESQIFRGEDGNIFFCSGEDCKSFSTWLKSKRKYTYPHSKQSFKWKVSFSQKSEFYLNHSNFKQSTGSLQRFGYSCKAIKNALGFRFWQSTKADSFIWKYNFQWKKKDS